MASNKVLQFSINRGVMHFQYGTPKAYAKFDQPLPKNINLKGLKTSTSLVGTDTTYYIVPQANLLVGRRAAFRDKRHFSLAKVASFVKANQ
jgi:hypothetical protein